VARIQLLLIPEYLNHLGYSQPTKLVTGFNISLLGGEFMYKLCEAVVFIFLGYYAAFALQMNAIGGIPSESADAVFLARSLVDYRTIFIVCLASWYVFFRVTGKQVHTVVTISAALAWVMFLEDLIALENAFFVPELTLAKIVQFTRPLFILGLTFMAVDAQRSKV
jgi:hypothetical protein